MIKLNIQFKRDDKWVTAEQCGVVTQCGETAAVTTLALACGVALVAAPAGMLTAAGFSAALLAAGHHLDHKKLEKQDNTPVSKPSVTA